MGSTPEMAPAPMLRVFSLAWLMARAFASNRVLAVVAYPMSLMSLVPYAVRRQLYETRDRDAMVVFGPYSLIKDAVVLFAVLIPFFVAWGSVMGYLPRLVPQVVVLVVAVVILAGVIILGGGSMGLPVGRETPKGERYQVAGLAQRPGTRFSGIQLAMRLSETLAPGSVLVASAASDRLVQQYQGLGFQRGKAHRVYWVAPA